MTEHCKVQPRISAMASRSLVSDVLSDDEETVVPSSSQSIVPVAVPQGQSTEIITRAFNPCKKFWQTPVMMPDEKPPKVEKSEIKIDVKSLRAKAVAQIKDDKVSIKVTPLAASQARSFLDEFKGHFFEPLEPFEPACGHIHLAGSRREA